MLKEVGASGQVSIGRRFAGQLFDVVFHADGRVEMLPMRAVPAPRPAPATDVVAADGWLPPGGYAACNTWALENREALEAYAVQVQSDGTAAEQLQRFLDSGPEPEGG
jgi:hypothetical protein